MSEWAAVAFECLGTFLFESFVIFAAGVSLACAVALFIAVITRL